jgi:hypothetical protein
MAMKEVKIVRFSLDPQADGQQRGVGNMFGISPYSGVVHTEEELTQLVNEGWHVVTAGGSGTGASTPIGFVVLVREQ